MTQTRMVHPDACAGGWDLVAEEIAMTDEDEQERGARLELPHGVPGQIGALLEAARGGATEAEIAAMLGVTARRVRQMLRDVASIRAAVDAAGVQQGLFCSASCDPQQRRRPRAMNRPRERAREPLQGVLL
ncbi:MAG: hypothetical protein ACYCQK_09085 [Acidiferrobacteraceae bacterium]